MNYPFFYSLPRPEFEYSSSTENPKPHSDRRRGLLKYGPLRPAKISAPNILFVFQESDRDFGNQLFIALKNGIARFPGLKRLTNISITADQVEPLRVSDANEETCGEAFATALEKRLSKGNLPDFAFVINTRQPNPLFKDPYQTSKVILIRHGIPSQYISWELLGMVNLFEFAVSNIALNMLVKLGGIPWSVESRNLEPSIILGIGTKRIQYESGKKVNWVGFCTNVLSNGIFMDSGFFPPSDQYQVFLQNLETGVKALLSKLLKTNRTIRKVTLLVSHFEKEGTFRTLRKVLTDFETTQKTLIPLELLRLTPNSEFNVYDLGDPGYVSREGTVVALSGGHSLLVAEGRTEIAAWRGRKPTTLEIHREFSTSRDLSFRESIEDAFNLAATNWRGFNAITQPISIQFSKLLADRVAALYQVDSEILSSLKNNPRLAQTPWFI